MIVLLLAGVVMFVGGVWLPHRLRDPWATLSALLGPAGLGLFAVGLLGTMIPNFFN